jgi:DNA-binding Lrp family transcriptional regulator
MISRSGKVGRVSWTLLSNHSLALVCVARQPGIRVREIADCVGVTERAAHRILSELCEAGYLSKHRVGARNFYEVHPDKRLRQPLISDHSLGDLLAPLLHDAEKEEATA